MSAWRRYDSPLLPAFHERFEKRWGEGTAPFLDPEVHEQPMPRAQWINIDTGAALAVVPVWTDDEHRRSFAMFYLPPAGDIWLLRPGIPDYIESENLRSISLRNDAFKKAVDHAKAFIEGSGNL
ncbi:MULTISPECIES: hypothetical protein [Paeniglutamicibacter]|uniref:Uncharacterized protein n=1 Tax=Paeniglutamicibacter sulfureus TaxID=43666 RepID=A0ABU2BHQ3_9MICC|nr:MULTISPECIES: hypothetical protein [Paeniglutamicibacter]MCV9992692.1 hypothetical protein [Paeniglutamicibacter sp. ZC-3]MDO2932983.1 hypothetical protein [Paeniglutamicibacter sulfureus]MDR7357268.1 hypothetical protein [Paeniglutamicibacter sulfureus]